jgi:hypothetical protein
MFLVYLLYTNQKAMAVLTKNTQGKKIRNAGIKKEYEELMKDPESQRSAVYEMLGYKHEVSSTTIGRIVGNIKTKKAVKGPASHKTPKTK